MAGTERNYEVLDAEKTVATIDRLSRRIDERFSGSGLYAVSRHLHGLAAAAGDRAAAIARPIRGLRILATVFVGAVLLVAVALVIELRPSGETLSWPGLIQVLEAGIQAAVYIGLGVFFLFTIGMRIRRRRLLLALHELRAVAHIIDMHQLTKDPERLRVVYTRGSSCLRIAARRPIISCVDFTDRSASANDKPRCFRNDGIPGGQPCAVATDRTPQLAPIPPLRL